MSERSQRAWELSLSAEISRRRDSISTDEKTCLTGDYRWNRSSGGRFAWTALAVRRAVPAARRSMTDPDNPYRMLSVTGEVDEITTDGAREHIDELAKRYTGEDEYPNPIETERVIISIEPTAVRQMEG